MVIAHSNNAWDMRGEAFGDASLYRIGVRAVQVPGVPATSSVAAAEQVVESPVDAVTSGLLAPQADRPQASPSPGTGLDGSQLQVSAAVDPSRWSDNVLRAVRVTGLALAAAVALVATTGFATTARRASSHRRRRALTRVRAAGATRVHTVSPPRERVGVADR